MLVFGILSAVGLGLYQFGEQHRFDMSPDAKYGGIFIIDRKSAAINYCDKKTCTLVNSALPSQIMNNPAALTSMQGAIMGAPAAAASAQPGQPPKGMQQNIALSGAAKKDKTADAATDSSSDNQEQDDESAAASTEEGSSEEIDAEATPGESTEAPAGYSFS